MIDLEDVKYRHALVLMSQMIDIKELNDSVAANKLLNFFYPGKNNAENLAIYREAKAIQRSHALSDQIAKELNL